MPQTTARNRFTIPLESDTPADLQAAFEAFMASGGDKVVQYDQGTLAQRPVSTSGQPGIVGRRYLATDDLSAGPNGTLYLDIGVAWVKEPVTVPDGAVSNAKLADNAVDQRVLGPDSVGAPEIIDGAVGNAEIAPKAVDSGKLADALKPSVSAGALTEALRAIGSQPGQVVGGDDTRLANIPTAAEKAGLDNPVGGVPGAGNGFVTAGDPTRTNQRTPADATVTLAKLAAGVSSRLIDVYELPAFNVGNNNTTSLFSKTYTMRGKPYAVIYWHSLYTTGASPYGFNMRLQLDGSIVNYANGSDSSTLNQTQFLFGIYWSAALSGDHLFDFVINSGNNPNTWRSPGGSRGWFIIIEQA